MAFSDALPLRDGFLTVKHHGDRALGDDHEGELRGRGAHRRAGLHLAGDDRRRWCGPQITALYAGGLCAQGTAVRYLVVPDESHFLVAFHTAEEAVAWMGDRFAGKPAPDDCVRGRP